MTGLPRVQLPVLTPGRTPRRHQPPAAPILLLWSFGWIFQVLKTWPRGLWGSGINQGKGSPFAKELHCPRRGEGEREGLEGARLARSSWNVSEDTGLICSSAFALGCPQPASAALEGPPRQEGREHILRHSKTLKLNLTTEENNFWELLQQQQEVCAAIGTSECAWGVNTQARTCTPRSCSHPECSANSTRSLPRFHLAAAPKPRAWPGGSRAVIPPLRRRDPPGRDLFQTVVGDHSSGKTFNVSII